jgi:hypothetical protein
MIVRHEQMNELQRQAERKFQNRLMAHLREMYPERLADQDDDDLREFCREGIVRARDLGIRAEYDVSRFLEYRVFLGESFDLARGPDWLMAILYGDGSGTYKMDRLDECYRVRGTSR